MRLAVQDHAPTISAPHTGGGGDSAGGIFRGENSVFQLGAEFSPHFSRGGAEFSPCGILPV